VYEDLSEKALTDLTFRKLITPTEAKKIKDKNPRAWVSAVIFIHIGLDWLCYFEGKSQMAPPIFSI
jgi:hypothetical protein